MFIAKYEKNLIQKTMLYYEVANNFIQKNANWKIVASDLKTELKEDQEYFVITLENVTTHNTLDFVFNFSNNDLLVKGWDMLGEDVYSSQNRYKFEGNIFEIENELVRYYSYH